MADERWTENRNTAWERQRRRERLESRPETREDYGQADYTGSRSYAPQASRPADDHGYRPFGDTGPVYTASGAYGPDGQRYGGSRDYAGRDPYANPGYRDFEAAQLRRHGGDYDPDRYTPNPREGRGHEGRSWWDRTQDELSALFGDEEAKRRRHWDEQRADQAGEHRGRGPKGYRRSDERMRDDINDRLTDDAYLDASEIEVSVKDGEATLSGTVFRREDKRRAEDLAERVSGVSHVQNNLRLSKADGGPSLI